MFNRNAMGFPRTPAPVRNSSLLMSASAILETPTMIRKTGSQNTGPANSGSILQPASAASAAAMQFLMMQTAFTNPEKAHAAHQKSIPERTESSVSHFNLSMSNIPDSTTTVATRIIENYQVSSNGNELKRKLEPVPSKSSKRGSFELLPLRPHNRIGKSNFNLKALPPIPSRSDRQDSSSTAKPNVGSMLRIITGSVDNILKLSKSPQSGDGLTLVELFANILSFKTGAYDCEKILLLRNRSGPIIQGVFYEIDFRMAGIGVGDLVRCVGRLSGGSRLQILKITHASLEDEQMAARLQTVSGFVTNVKR
ncbi:uncharacterized protein LOC129749748 [Uranotaenia lowii]|uniref:uncharacterized protein LOC129749748 n=1 Tax=Uranotaenia lowii TaxID=190385 RepID=UPI0024792BA5|nr:uncharacterized protein LOC129749748 [Uranotaenia lowii]XP_055600790.1 uncharacterized protein LOC129749748 [Uranotaenia lowii]